MESEGQLRDSVSVVTGASRGIGRATAVELARVGSDVLICSRDTDELMNVKQEIGGDGSGDIEFARVDVTDQDSVEMMVEKAVEVFGGIDVLVNNAGVTGEMREFDETPMEEYRRVFDVNFFGLVRVTKTCLPQLRSGGSVVNVASSSAVNPKTSPPYNASKAAVINLTKTLSKTYAPEVRFNSVTPGPTMTEMVRGVVEEKAEEENLDFEEAYRRYVEEDMPEITFDRVAEPGEVASVIRFLASPESSFVTGANYRVDGGVITTVDL